MSTYKSRLVAVTVGLTIATALPARAQSQQPSPAPPAPMSALAKETLVKVRAKAPFDLTGMWQHDGRANTWRFVPDTFKLTPEAQIHYDRGVKALKEGGVYRDDIGQCWPAGLPLIMTRVWPIAMIQLPTAIYMISHFMNSVRVVYLDGREPPPADVTQYLGFSRGHWDGDTLVIETTNFTPGMSNGATPNSAQMKLTERLTPMGPDQIRYEAWVEDAMMFAEPYKIDMPWRRNPNYEFYEYACHEGNVQIRGYITATSPRFQKLREEQWAKQGEEPSPVAGPGGAP